MNYLQRERLDALAREYAVGTLHGGARRRFERLLRDERAARVALAAWQRRLDPLADTVPPMKARPEVWQQLEQRLFPAAAAPPAPMPWWKAMFGGRVLGGALAGVLLATAVLQQQPAWLGLEPASETLPASYVGLLTDAAGQPVLLASSRRHGRTLTVKLLQPLAVPPGRVAQLWALPKDGSAPFAVGVVPAQGSATIALPDTSERLFSNVTRLAVSLEPAAGAAQPSSAFVISGPCVKLW
jgi:anti-sigma-K factor RskA